MLTFTYVGQIRRASRLRVKQVAAASRAKSQHISWIKQSNREEGAYKEIRKVDPVVRSRYQQAKSILEFEAPNRLPEAKTRSPEVKGNSEDALLRDIIQPSFKSEIGILDFGQFGRITAVHGDIFAQPGSIVVYPIPANLMPYRGLSLSALERGGDKLLRELFSTARLMYSEHVIPPPSEGNEGTGQRRLQNRGIPIGSVIPVEGALFVVTPHYWQGTASDANQRLRFAIKKVVDYAVQRSAKPITRLVIPHIGRGEFGYEAQWSTEALVEEAIEGLLQLDVREVVKSPLHEIAFIDNDLETATEFKETIETLADRWLPERRVTTAPQFLSKTSRRMIVMDENSELSTMRRRDKYKFKQYHGKLRNKGGRYFRETIQPWIWRTQKVLEPPPLLVNKQSGEIADKQREARPYFFRGLSHTLFPVNLRTGFPSLRRGQSGQLVGVRKQPDTQKIAKPRT